MWRQPPITSLSVLQNLLGPFTLIVPVSLFAWALAASRFPLAGALAAWLLVGRAIKAFRHLIEQPGALLLLPFVTLVFIILMIPIKLYALLTLNRQGWVTRTSDGAVAEGQASTTLSPSFGLNHYPELGIDKPPPTPITLP
jgi:hyaluronan synthase